MVEVGKLKIPMSKMAYKEFGIRYFSTEFDRKKLLFKEHILPVKKRIQKGLSLIRFCGYDKDRFYEWLIDTLYLVYKLRSEHKESINGGELAEKVCLFDEHHKPEVWKTYEKTS